MTNPVPTLVHWTRWWLAAAACVLSLAPPVVAQQVPGQGGWSPAAGAVGDNTIAGFVDQPAAGATIPLGSTFHVSGWVVDTTATGWAGIDDVQVLNGSTVLAHAVVGQNRPDVASITGNPYWAASGFDAVVSSGGLTVGSVSLTVLAHTPGRGGWSSQVNVNVSGSGSVVTTPGSASGLVLTIISPGASENVIANHNGVIRGVAYDTRTRADLGVGVDWVNVYLDGPPGVAGSQTLGTATQTDNTWSLAWEPTKYDRVPHHFLWVYAHSSVTGEVRLVNQEIYIVKS